METKSITIECIPMSTFSVEDRNYAICVLRSEDWESTRLQVFTFDDPSLWTEAFRPDRHCTISLKYEQLEKVIESSTGTSTIKVGKSWPKLVELNPKLFPYQGIILGISSNAYRAIAKAPNHIKSSAIRELFTAFSLYRSGKLSSLDALFDTPLIQIYSDCYRHLVSGSHSLKNRIVKQGIKHASYVSKIPPYVHATIPGLARGVFTGRHRMELVKEKGYYVNKNYVTCQEVVGVGQLGNDKYLLSYTLQAGQAYRIKDVLESDILLESGIPYTIELLP